MSFEEELLQRARESAEEAEVYVVETEITNLDTGEVRRILKKILIVK